MFYPGIADSFDVHASTPAGTAAPRSNTLFVARQPILTADEGVYGYELLFRDGVADYCAATDIEVASRSTLSASTLMGLDSLCDGRRAFINVTREVLLGGYVTLLPATQVVVEVLETVAPDEFVVEACKSLKESGYLIALDDFVAGDPRESMAGLADVIKVDLRQTSLNDAAAMVQRHGASGCRMLAEKVETREEFLAFRSAGFVLFQGYFFRKPETLTTHEIPANQMNYLRMWQTVSKAELNLREVESVIKSEASLCYRLLRYLNSPVFGFGNEISSIRHALTILGEREIRRWVRLVATLGAGQNKSSELVLSALIRARFCELLSPKIQHGGSDLFLIGLLSLMDAILEIPMAQVLESIPVDRESKAVLMGGGSQLQPVYQLMLAQESGEWQTCGELARGLRLHENEVPQKYWEAVDWARRVNGA
jgi:c-di-GMP-related signal transduction protein